MSTFFKTTIRSIRMNQKGEEVKKQVTYVIGTDPVITVFREISM